MQRCPLITLTLLVFFGLAAGAVFGIWYFADYLTSLPPEGAAITAGAKPQDLIMQEVADPKPFHWTKTADDILASIERFCRRTLAVQAQCG